MYSYATMFILFYFIFPFLLFCATCTKVNKVSHTGEMDGRAAVLRRPATECPGSRIWGWAYLGG